MMKKIIISFISIIAVALLLCACTNSQNQSNNENTQTPNPISSISVDEMKNDLGLKEINLDKIESTNKIDGENPIYSIDVIKDDKAFNIRIARSIDDAEKDISGVYLSGKAECSIYDSADVDIAPSIYVECDKDNSKAYCSWNGYLFSVSTDSNITNSKMQQYAVDFAKELLHKDNLTDEQNDIENQVVKKDFEINFIPFDDNTDYDMKKVYNAEDYSVNTYGGDVTITVEGDMVYDLADALNKQVITPNDIVDKCIFDEKNEKIKTAMYKDGGSMEYYYDDYTVLKYNCLDENKDLVIGRKGAIIYTLNN